jgi:hypothetical protein
MTRPCRVPLYWHSPNRSDLLGPVLRMHRDATLYDFDAKAQVWDALLTQIRHPLALLYQLP